MGFAGGMDGAIGEEIAKERIKWTCVEEEGGKSVSPQLLTHTYTHTHLMTFGLPVYNASVSTTQQACKNSLCLVEH